MNGLELTSVTPFNLLSNEQLERLSRHSDLIYLDQQQTFSISSQPITERCNDPVNNCTCYSCSKNGAYEYDERTRNQALDS
jgi:hypothetical protein